MPKIMIILCGLMYYHFRGFRHFEAKACPCGMNRSQCTMMAERSGLRYFPMKHNLLVVFLLSLPPPCPVPEMAGVCGGNFNLQPVHLHCANISLVHQRKCY